MPSASGGQESAVDPLELQLQRVESQLKVLGNEPKFSAGVASALNAKPFP